MNWPMRLTMLRFALLPLIMLFYILAVSTFNEFFMNWGRLIAFLLFAVAAITDFWDGYLARKNNEVSTLGKLLDPVADKMLVTLGFVLILADPIWHIHQFDHPATIVFPFWFAVLAVFVSLSRDIIMNSLRFIAAEQGIVIEADKLGKAKTFAQAIAIGLYMMFAFNMNWMVQFIHPGIAFDLWTFVCIFMMSTAAVLSVWSCCTYISNYVKQVRQEEPEDGEDSIEAVATVVPGTAEQPKPKAPAKPRAKAQPKKEITEENVRKD